MKNLVDLKDVKISTLSDLEAFFHEKNISQEKTRFFINENRQDPKCFGIYQDVETGEFIVYKNKDDGSRFIRFQGLDEAAAVDIFFSKLKQEMGIRDKSKSNQTNKRYKKARRKKTLTSIVMIVCVSIILIILLGSILSFGKPKRGYYSYNNNYYYYNNKYWYVYDDYYDDWFYYSDGISDYDNYYVDKYYSDDLNINPIDSEYEYYEDDNDYSYSDNDFDDYDFSDWSSSDTDWGSDW